MSPRLIDKAERRREIAEALWRVVSDQGIGAVSVRTVAAEAGISTGSLRHVFPTRTELLIHSAELMADRVETRIVAEPVTEPALEYCFRLMCHLLPLTEQGKDEFDAHLAMIAEIRAVPELLPILQEVSDKMRDLMRRVVTALSPGEAPDDVEFLAAKLQVVVDGLAMMVAVGEGTSEVKAQCVDILRATLEEISRPS